MSRERCSRRRSSTRASAASSWLTCCRRSWTTRRRSTARPSRLFSAVISVPIAVSRNTGATASWITRVMSAICVSIAGIDCDAGTSARASVERDRLSWPPVDVELEHVGPRIVAGDVEAAPGDAAARGVHLGVQDSGLFRQRPGLDLAPRRDDDRVARIDPLVRIRVQARALGKAFRYIGPPHRQAGADNPAAAFARNVLQGADPALAGIVGRRNIDLDALRVERIARERHVTLPAQERPDPSPGRILHSPPSATPT